MDAAHIMDEVLDLYSRKLEDKQISVTGVIAATRKSTATPAKCGSYSPI